MQKQSSLAIVDRPINFPKHVCVMGFNYRQSDTGIHFLHQHAYVELGYCHRGEGIFLHGHEVIRYQAGDVVVIPAGQPHLAQSAVGTTSDWTFSYVETTRLSVQLGQLASNMQLAVQHFGHFSALEYKPISTTALLLSEQLGSTGSPANDMVSGYVLALFSLIAAVLGATQTERQLPPQTKKLAPAIAYLAQYFAEPFCVDQLAADCGVSTVQFRRLFQQNLGLSPRNYLFKLRIEMAKVMLGDPKNSILDISMAVGFVTLSSFNRQFKRFTATSPSQWRKAQYQRTMV